MFSSCSPFLISIPLAVLGPVERSQPGAVPGHLGGAAGDEDLQRRTSSAAASVEPAAKHRLGAAAVPGI